MIGSANSLSSRLLRMPWQEFQGLARDFFRIVMASHTAEWGTTGQQQDGIDIAVWDTSLQIKAVAQCKRWTRVDSNDLDSTFGKFISARKKYPHVTAYVLFTTATPEQLSDETPWRKIDKFICYCQSTNIDFRIVHLRHIVSWLLKNESTTDKYFRYWKFFDLYDGGQRLPDNFSALSYISPILRTIHRSEHAESLFALGRITELAGTSQVSSLAERWKLVRSLLLEEQFQSDWELRRSLGAVLGGLLDRAAVEECPKVAEEMGELCLNSPSQSVTLAMALTHVTAPQPAKLGEVITKLFRHPHPQVGWQLAKGAQQLYRIFGADRFDAAAAFADNGWVRERLTLTALREALINGDNVDLTSLQHTLPGRSRFLRFIANVESIISGDLATLDSAMLVDGVCLQADIESDKFKGRVGKGRYEAIRHALIRLISDDPKAIELVTTCADEGGRWALANSIPVWGKSSNRGTFKKAVFQLVDDPHPWTVRETLSRLEEVTDRFSPKEFADLLSRARNAIAKAEGDGWDVTELREAYVHLLSLRPNWCDTV